MTLAYRSFLVIPVSDAYGQVYYLVASAFGTVLVLADKHPPGVFLENAPVVSYHHSYENE